ncbi:MAG: putative inner membrane protein [Syntrophaceae bacterium PtaU1.Bin231]|nr:MAG: putative inner membrane protein [Syntrophaceae bacterium PtaU1.Bin231]
MKQGRTKNREIVFLALLIGVTLLFLLLLKSFFFPIFWAAVIAAIFRPLCRRLETVLRGKSAAAAVTLALVVILIFIPAAIVGTVLVAESVQLYDAISSGGAQLRNGMQSLQDFLERLPFYERIQIPSGSWSERFAEVYKGIAGFFLDQLRSLTQNTLLFLVQFAVMLYTLFFFLRDGDRFLSMVMRLIPLGDVREKALYQRFAATARATIKVTLIIGGIQGILGSIIFFAVGIKGALVWGVIMIFTSIVPAVGCSIVWAPAGLLLIFSGALWKGIAVLVYGVAVISMADNLLRPLLLGKDVQMHPLLIFLSTLGGISLFGMSGFVLGPIITALLITVWEMSEEIFGTDGSAEG